MRVAVIGAGSIGSQTAWKLAEAGAKVTVFDQFDAPNEDGAHAGESRLLRTLPYLETGAGDVQILRDSAAAWDELEAKSGIKMVTRCGGLILDSPQREPFAKLLDSTDALPLSPDKIAERFPQFSVQGSTEGVLDELGGLVDPQLAVSAALGLAKDAGASVRLHTRVDEVAEAADAVLVRVAGKELVFDRVVIATGAYARSLFPELPIHSRRLLLGWFKPKPGYEKLIADMPSFVWTDESGQFLYGGPSYDGKTIKIGGDAAWGDVDDPSDGREVTAADSAPIRERVREYFPWLESEGDRFEMHIDGWSQDQRGMLGAYGSNGRVVLSTGWSGHGFKISPVIGEITADLVLHGSTTYDIQHLSPERFEKLTELA